MYLKENLRIFEWVVADADRVLFCSFTLLYVDFDGCAVAMLFMGLNGVLVIYLPFAFQFLYQSI